MIILQTNYGDISIELDFENTPATAKNFLTLAKNGFYDNTIFHRIINGFMIQGGGFGPHMQQKKSSAAIENEADKGGTNKRYTIAMARTADPHSATSQFFINVADNAFLNFKSKTMEGWGYCVFGKVIAGMEVVDKIKIVSTTRKAGHQDVPVDDVIIEKVVVNAETSDIVTGA
ncbi:MAG TPA: peptidylprolyl isomerase [Gammaproteobacteria bacterium]|nr:peptidylprolyl isomerase [Gammaproteobacteria bacterium]